MIGRVAVPDSEVPRRPNIVYLGRRPYETLPAYGKAFTAAIIPYHLTQQVLHANPIKLREYLAMGRPIVSVSTPEIDKFAEVVAIARNREEFLARLDEAVGKGLSKEQVERHTKLASTMTWDARLRKVVEIVEGALGRADCGAIALAEDPPAGSPAPKPSLAAPRMRGAFPLPSTRSGASPGP